jgi:ABC-type multidrug transport system ATPase subunit
VAVHSHPDIVLVDEVLSVGDAAFRRRALEALRRLITEGKTVLFISHDMWNVRRLCSDILWMEDGGVRAYGPAGEIAERYMNEVNLEALANQATALQSHRGGTGEGVDGRLIDEAGTGMPRGATRLRSHHAGQQADTSQVVVDDDIARSRPPLRDRRGPIRDGDGDERRLRGGRCGRGRCPVVDRSPPRPRRRHGGAALR